jgi:hypothetical protein
MIRLVGIMFIKTIVEEGISAREKDDIVTNCAELIQVKQAIDRLDGETKTAVVLKLDDDNLMIVGGGANKKYIVFAKLAQKSYYMANKFPINSEPMMITVAKQKGKYPARRCLGLDMVLESAKHFAHRGALAQTFNWERV